MMSDVFWSKSLDFKILSGLSYFFSGPKLVVLNSVLEKTKENVMSKTYATFTIRKRSGSYDSFLP